jgi:CHAD domain-containing protein
MVPRAWKGNAHRMSFRLEKGEPMGPGLLRIVLQETGAAAQALDRASQEDWEEAIHDARKRLKKSRAVVRLARSSIGPLYREANVVLRDIGRGLSEVRDAGVLVSTVDKLAEVSGDEMADLFGPVRRILDERSDRMIEEAQDEGLAERAADRIRRAGGLITKGPWSGREWGFIEGGLERQYRRGRSAFREARRDPQAETVHEWRKRAKDHWYHLRLLAVARPSVMKKAAKAAHSLSDLLGDEHDLVVLEETLRKGRGTLWDPARVDSIGSIAERRRRELLDEADPLGKRLYAEKPAKFTKRIRRYWNASMSEAPEHVELQSQAAGA